MLRRAAEAAQMGEPSTARTQALDLLGFHAAALKQYARSSSLSDTSSASTELLGELGGSGPVEMPAWCCTCVRDCAVHITPVCKSHFLRVRKQRCFACSGAPEVLPGCLPGWLRTRWCCLRVGCVCVYTPGKLSSGSTSPSSDEDNVGCNPPAAGQTEGAVCLDEPAPPCPKRRRVDGGSSATSADYSGPSDTSTRDCFAVPRTLPNRSTTQQLHQPPPASWPPYRRNHHTYTTTSLHHHHHHPHHHVHHSRTSARSSQQWQPQHAAMPCVSSSPGAEGQHREWQGGMHMHLEDFSCSELCRARVQLPQDFVCNALPPNLIFTHIVQRRGVTLGKHKVGSDFAWHSSKKSGNTSFPAAEPRQKDSEQQSPS